MKIESLYLCRIAKRLDLYKNDKYPWSILYKTKHPDMYYLDTSRLQSVTFFLIRWSYGRTCTASDNLGNYGRRPGTHELTFSFVVIWCIVCHCWQGSELLYVSLRLEWIPQHKLVLIKRLKGWLYSFYNKDLELPLKGHVDLVKIHVSGFG